jgi:hypothetical protein
MLKPSLKCLNVALKFLSEAELLPGYGYPGVCDGGYPIRSSTDELPDEPIIIAPPPIVHNEPKVVIMKEETIQEQPIIVYSQLLWSCAILGLVIYLLYLWTHDEDDKIDEDCSDVASTATDDSLNVSVKSEDLSSPRRSRKSPKKKTTPRPFGVGTRVEALYRGRNKEVSHGTITHVNPKDATYDLRYDCGEVATHVQGEMLRVVFAWADQYEEQHAADELKKAEAELKKEGFDINERVIG